MLKMAFLPYLILIISSLRGLFLLGFSLPPTPYIFFSFTIVGIVLVVLSAKIFIFMKKPGPLHGYLKLFLINVIFGIVWCFGEIIIVGFNLESLRAFLFYFIIPISVFLFIRAKENYLIATIYFIGIVVALSCIIDFIICNLYPGPPIGYEIKRPILDALVPFGSPRNPSHIGLVSRAHGITGNYHDSAHILTMVSVFSVGKLLFEKKNKILVLILTIIILFGLFSTLSTSNIIAGIIGITIVAFYPSRGIVIRIIYLSITGYLIFLFFQGGFFLFDQVSPDLDMESGKMKQMTQLGTSSYSNIIISSLLGHEHLSGISDLGKSTEIALFSMITYLGIITIIPLLSLICYPFYIYLNSNQVIKEKMWVPIITLFTGIITLWHYASLFRSTSIFLFFAFYSMVIKTYSERKFHLWNYI